MGYNPGYEFFPNKSKEFLMYLLYKTSKVEFKNLRKNFGFKWFIYNDFVSISYKIKS